MAETASNMMPLGSKAPDFSLYDVITEQKVSLNDIASNKATVIMFICNHCPYVIHIHAKLLEVINHYSQLGISFAAISANDVTRYPQDGPEAMRAQAEKYAYRFPYLYDESQEVARAYLAACTPDFYIFDRDLKCVYRGRFDSSTPGNQQPVTGEELSDALDRILAEQDVNPDQKPSLGCNIKWK